VAMAPAWAPRRSRRRYRSPMSRPRWHSGCSSRCSRPRTLSSVAMAWGMPTSATCSSSSTSSPTSVWCHTPTREVFGFDYKLIIGGKSENPAKRFVFRSILKTTAFYQIVRLARPDVFQNACPTQYFPKCESITCPRHRCSLSRLIRRHTCSAVGSAAPLLPCLTSKLGGSPAPPFH
jgi:hypothetical protein